MNQSSQSLSDPFIEHPDSILVSLFKFITCQHCTRVSISVRPDDAIRSSGQQLAQEHQPQQKPQINLPRQYPKEYRERDLVVIGAKKQTFMIVGRETHKAFMLSVGKEAPSFRDTVQSFFKIVRYQQAVSYIESELSVMAPEIVAKYVAWKCGGSMSVLDMSWASGLFAIHFSEIVNHVTHISDDPTELQRTSNNLAAYRKEADVDVLLAGLNQIRAVDVVFMDLTLQEKWKRFGEYFSQAIRVSANTMTLLPATFDKQEVASMLWEMDYETHFERFFVEIEQIIIDGKLEYMILYTGSLAQADQKEFYLILSGLLLQYGTHVSEIDFTQIMPTVIQQIDLRVGTHELLLQISSVAISHRRTLLQRFIKQMLNLNILTLNEIRNIAAENQRMNVKSFQTYQSDGSYMKSSVILFPNTMQQIKNQKPSNTSSDAECSKNLASASGYLESFSQFTGENSIIK